MFASTFRRVCAPLVLVAALVGCGGDDDTAQSGQDGGASAGSGGSSSKLDACKLVTAQDASTLFGQSAMRDEDELVVDPALLGQCQWTYEQADENGSVASQSLQFYVWASAQYHSVPDGASPLDVGQDGYVSYSDSLGVDIGWIQDGRAIALSYFSIGPDMPSHASKLEPMKTLAGTISQRL